jgi:hypothetical protein
MPDYPLPARGVALTGPVSGGAQTKKGSPMGLPCSACASLASADGGAQTLKRFNV